MVKKDAKPEPASPKKDAKPDNGNGEAFNVATFVQGTREELSKVVWPSQQQLLSESAAVILMVSLSATVIYFVDKLFGWISGYVF